MTVLVGAALVVSGCAQTTRVDNATTSASLAGNRKAVAIMRVGAASPTCDHAQVLLAVRDGEGYRRIKPMTVLNLRSLTEAPVGEVELDPGEYHVVAYACVRGKGAKVVGDDAGNYQTFRTSYAHFQINAGEILNVGYLHFHAKRADSNALGRAIEANIKVTDWPLAELDRFKAKRGPIFAQMMTRLMTVSTLQAGATVPADCARYKALKVEGKVQSVPADCG